LVGRLPANLHGGSGGFSLSGGSPVRPFSDLTLIKENPGRPLFRFGNHAEHRPGRSLSGVAHLLCPGPSRGTPTDYFRLT